MRNERDFRRFEKGIGWEFILLRVLRSLKDYNVSGIYYFFGLELYLG